MNINDNLELNAFSAKLLFKNQVCIAYYPAWKEILGCEERGVLIASQIRYLYWTKFSGRAFYYFQEKPSESNSYYQKGQSWCEILFLKKNQLEASLYGTDKKGGKIATKVTKEMAIEAGFPSARSYIKYLMRESKEIEHLVLLLTDSQNRTWHFFNEFCFRQLLKEYLKKNHQEMEDSDYADDAFSLYDKKCPEDSTIDYLEGETPGTPIKVKFVKKYTPEQRKMFNSKPMPEYFQLTQATIDKAVKIGYDWDELLISIGKFYNYYKEHTDKKSGDWDDTFLNAWLVRAYEFNEIKRNGQYKKPKFDQVDAYRNSEITAADLGR